MTLWTLIFRSLRFHARAHLGVLFGTAVGSAVLIGALVVGDSVRGSLRDLALARLGKVDFALASGDRLFRARLAEDLQSRGGLNRETQVVPALQLLGTAATGDGSARANRVQVNGVDERFWKLAPQAPALATLPADGVVLNEPLARQLRVQPGDAVLVRVPKPSQLSRDAPLSPEEDAAAALRLTVHAVVNDAQFGRFSLQANQVAPFNAFIALNTLQTKSGATNRANLLLVAAPAGPEPQRQLNALAKLLPAALSNSFTLDDAQLQLRELPGRNQLELRTGRVFLDAPVVEAARKAAPDAQLILTYFFNELRLGSNTAPYSMATAMDPAPGAAALREDEIVLNEWAAEDLHARPGDRVALSYYIVGAGRKLEERTNSFTVRQIVPITGAAADRELMPDFPGMTGAENCRDWDTGFPIKLDRIRDREEKYWDDYRGTPKAFISAAAGQRLWANRFGDYTAVRFPAIKGEGNPAASLTQALLARLSPAAVGLSFQPVRQQALTAVNESLDFGQLFLSFSFFLIVAALLLTALLFQFGLEQRAAEVGTLLALGFTPRAVRRLWLLEGGALALLGALAGMAGGIGYARAMLWGLSTIWREAIAATQLNYHASALTLVAGVLASTLAGWGTLWVTLRRQARQPARVLLAGGASEEPADSKTGGNRHPVARWTAIGALAGAAAIIVVSVFGGGLAAPAFFGAGGLLLIAALAGIWLLLCAAEQHEAEARMTLGGLGVRNAARRRRRSLAIAAMLACGSFLVAAVGINRLDAGREAFQRRAGTGGFALIGESALPVVHDLNTAAGRDYFGLEERQLAGVSVVPFRVRDGDEASCLNLNRAQKPRLLGVNPDLLAGRGAFTFAALAKGAKKEKPWTSLARGEFYPLAEDEVAAIGDAASIQWALGKKVGDTLDYTDERGRPFKLRLIGAVAGSILQGNLLIDEAEFVKRFPSESGYRLFLVDAAPTNATAVAAVLSRGLRDVGLELTPCAERLAAFNAVQNTYLSTFQVLGGLGLLLGSAGLGVVVLRNVLERRGELALLLAVGFRARAIKWLVISEHGALLLLGLLAGIVAALVAVLPGLLAPGAERHYLSLIATLAGVLLSGALWTWLAAALALRGELLKGLRNE